ncbi:MAG: DUF4080 domain-containing protein [Methylococcales bacterium]|nr:DUF4080 domain-containing protein [Methylococcales bacterium]
MSRIVITTLNARYIHTAFGLRYLYANLGDLQGGATLLEFSIRQKAAEIVEQLLRLQPEIIGFGVYIWNVAEIGQVVGMLKQVAPQVVVVLGGPEVSYPPDLPDMVGLCDYIITGQGEISFPLLCRQIQAGSRPVEKVIAGETAQLTALASPYPYYDETDIRQRIVYVEASRGCPFKCEFCLSALDLTARPFELQAFLRQMADLYRRGARNFKFIDRTFNLKVDASVAILEFFLDRLGDGLYLHFEVIPDNLPDRLKQIIMQFPPGVLQFEIGVQSFDPVVQQRINRRQDNDKTVANLDWLRTYTHTHIHADLIVGLPGDTLEGFGDSFDKLIVLKPQEIQVGILKRLRGAPINQHTDAYRMRYDPNPPYAILCNRDIDFNQMQRLNRFARFWDLIGNSGRFTATLPLILAGKPFQRFMQLSDALYERAGSTWQIGLKRLFELVYLALTEALGESETASRAALFLDYQRCGEKGSLILGNAGGASVKRGIANRRQLQGLSGYDLT